MRALWCVCDKRLNLKHVAYDRTAAEVIYKNPVANRWNNGTQIAVGKGIRCDVPRRSEFAGGIDTVNRNDDVNALGLERVRSADERMTRGVPEQLAQVDWLVVHDRPLRTGSYSYFLVPSGVVLKSRSSAWRRAAYHRLRRT